MFIIDAHEDLAYNALTHGRDYTLSAAENRRREANTEIPARVGGQVTLGWEDYQRGQVGMVFATLFTAPRRYSSGEWETYNYANTDEARRIYHQHLDFYSRLCDENPQKFRLVRTRQEMASVLQAWERQPAEYPTLTHPVGLVMLMENAEGVAEAEELEEYWQYGLRIIGPVWSGGRLCGGTNEPGGFTAQGRHFLEVMADLGYVLDVAHMNEESALEALDRYPGAVICSHANARALIPGARGERHLTDRTIASLVERGGVMGVLPYNRFMKPEWKNTDDRALVRLDLVAAHIDHICQIAGDATHAAFGTDFDGGFGWPAIPQEMDTIADLQKLAPILAGMGYAEDDIAAVFGVNWRRLLERALP